MFSKIFLAISFFVLFFTPPDLETISWRESTKLTWHNFKGQPNKNIEAVALTASGITFEFSIQETETRVVSYNAKVYAHFYPEKSWYIKELGNDHILAHEQLHFDITELFARKFRKQISELKLSNSIRTQIQSIHKNINKELASTQKRYDMETDHSRKTEIQTKWVLYVKKELQRLEAFKSKE